MCISTSVSALDKEETKMGGGGGSENKAESVLPLPSSFSKFRCNAKNGIQKPNPKDKNQVSRDIKEQLWQQTYLYGERNLCYDIFPNCSSRVGCLSLLFFFFFYDFASSVCLTYQKFLKFTR